MTEAIKEIILKNHFPLYGKIISDFFSRGEKFTIRQGTFREHIYEEFEKEGLVKIRKYTEEVPLKMKDYFMEITFTPEGIDVAKRFKEENKDMKFPMVF